MPCKEEREAGSRAASEERRGAAPDSESGDTQTADEVSGSKGKEREGKRKRERASRNFASFLLVSPSVLFCSFFNQNPHRTPCREASGVLATATATAILWRAILACVLSPPQSPSTISPSLFLLSCSSQQDPLPPSLEPLVSRRPRLVSSHHASDPRVAVRACVADGARERETQMPACLFKTETETDRVAR